MANDSAVARPLRRLALGSLVGFVLLSTVLANTLPGRAVMLGWHLAGSTAGVQSRAEDGQPSLYRPGKHIDVFHDSAPFSGRSGCTGAFVVQRFGQDHGLTSKHCGEVGSEVWLGRYGGEAVRLGEVAFTATTLDAAMFPVGETEGDVWAADEPKRVSGMVPGRDLRPGMKLYQHGSTTGREILAYAVGPTDDGLWCMNIDPGDQAPGDSGGPVYTYAADGSILAVGITKSHATNGNTGLPISCFVPIDGALRELSARLKVRDAEGRPRYVAPG